MLWWQDLLCLGRQTTAKVSIPCFVLFMLCGFALLIILVHKILRLQVMCMACLVGELHTVLSNDLQHLC